MQQQPVYEPDPVAYNVMVANWYACDWCIWGIERLPRGKAICSDSCDKRTFAELLDKSRSSIDQRSKMYYCKLGLGGLHDARSLTRARVASSATAEAMISLETKANLGPDIHLNAT